MCFMRQGTRAKYGKLFTVVYLHQNHVLASVLRFGKSIQKKLIEWIKTKIPSDSFILDVGCGNGQFLAILVSRRYLVSLDGRRCPRDMGRKKDDSR